MKTIREFFEEHINEQLIQTVVSGRRTGEGPSKVKLRPVELKGQIFYQASMTEGTKVYHKNFTREEMKRVYQGIYVKKLPLFKGELLEYQIYERGEKGAVLVKEGRTCCDPERAGRENSRFACLNQMSEAVAKQDAEGLLGAMEDYVKRSAALGILFPVN